MKISVITICRNSDQTLTETIESVLAQRDVDLEFIVIDGDSTDDTHKILNTYRSRISTLISEPDDGIYDAMNKGIAYTTGEIVAILNSDDRYPNNDILSTVAKAFLDPNIQVVFGDLNYIDPNHGNRIIRKWRTGPMPRAGFKRGWMPPHPAFFARRSVYIDHGGFNTLFKIAGDIEFMLRILQKHKLPNFYLQRVLVEMRSGGISNQSLKNIWMGNMECKTAYRINNMRFPLFFIPFKILRHYLQLR